MTTEEAAGPPAGFWPSPWSSAQVAAGKIGRGGLQVDQGRVAWIESRPDEGGRQVVVGVDPGAPEGAVPEELSPPGTSVRSRVHEYGGGAATLAGGVLYYVDERDQSWWRAEPNGAVPPFRLAGTGGPPVRYADGRPVGGGGWLVSVEEQLDGSSVSHRLVATPTDGGGPATVLVDQGDFVSSPRPSPDGRWMVWTSWDHPDMPWDSTTLWVARLSVTGDAVALGPARVVAGGPAVSVGQAMWTADGSLVYVDDRTGWWLPYRVAPGGLDEPRPPAMRLLDLEAEFHVPDWVFGRQTVAELDDGSLVARMGSDGRDHLVILESQAGDPDRPPWSCTVIEQPCLSIDGVVPADRGAAAVLGSTATEADAVFRVPLDGSGAIRRLSAPPHIEVGAARTSHGEHRIALLDGGHRVPGHFFPPCSPDVARPDGRLPPLVVFCHGGPTAAAEPGYDPVVQFLTSRGLAVAAVDYRGSTGYGRAYRDLLRGTWGEGDVDDCVDFARSLVRDGLVDGARMAIRGTSAGGLTALSALIRSRVFAGAVAWYGVTDLAALATDTHDFESRYLDGLVGVLPDSAAVYRDRSPLHLTAHLEGRVLLLQGSDDPIVPLDQAERFAAELRAGGADCRLVVFAGESHGFRRAETIEAALDAELGFYRDMFVPVGDPHG